MSTTADLKKNLYILVVEDSLTQAKMMGHFLERKGYLVHLCYDGEEAYKWLQSTPPKPDIIISDIQMPKMDGYALCRAIRADKENKDIPVILLTSLSEPQNIIQSIESGANKFLVKPYDTNILPEVIDELYFNMQRRKQSSSDDEITLRFGGNDFSIKADKVQLLDLLISSYEDSYYRNRELQDARSKLEELNEELEEKVQERTKELNKLSQAIEQNENGIIITDINCVVEYTNSAFERMTGYTKSETVSKKLHLHPICPNSEDICKEIIEQLKLGKSYTHESLNSRKNGTEYIESVKYSPIFQSDGAILNYLVIREDITDKKNAQERIHYLANYDALTGLPNRVQLEEKVKTIISFAEQKNQKFAVLFIGLDHFKKINDTLGHNVGDTLLIGMSKRFESLLHEEDMVSRFSGDKFIMLLHNMKIVNLTDMLQKLLEITTIPLVIDENELIVTASIGVCVYPSDGTDTQTIFKNADVAMYNAKREGRNCYRFFTPEMLKDSYNNLELSNALYHALELNQLHVAYQPQISLHTNRVIGAEALLRWTHPILGNIPPDRFIPLAEENGLILQIGEWVFRTAVQQTQKWIESGLGEMIIAVNVSAVQFRHPNLPTLITEVLEQSQLLPQHLEIELTEAAAMSDPQKVYEIMNNLNGRGIRMAIDDFGTGYSSLSYLKKFKVYKLKIDQSFVREISNSAEDKAIVDAIISMSKSLGLKTIAEGVETEEQLDYLQEHGCDEIQGYYYSKPLPAEEFELFVREKNQVNDKRS